MAHKIAIFAGSTRTGSINQKFADAIADLMEKDGLEVTRLTLKDYPMPMYNGDWEDEHGQPEETKALIAKLLEHDGVFIVTPEYNGSLPPLLKNAIDWTTRLGTEHFKKPIYGIGAASGGATAGIMVMRELAMILRRLGANVIPAQVGLGNESTAYNEDGTLKDGRTKDFTLMAIDQMKRLMD